MGTVVRRSCYKHGIRYGLILLGTAAVFGCDGDGVTDSDSTGPPVSPSYSLALSALALSSAQGAASGASPTTVSLVRTGAFAGSVTLGVDNLPTGVDAFFYPASPLSGSSTQLWLYAAGGAPAGTFTNLLVRGVAAGLPDQTAPLTLTITVAPFVLTLSSTTISVMQGTATTTTVNLVQNDFAGPVTFGVDLDLHGTMPPGVTATFAPNPTTGTRSVLTLGVSAAAVPGVYDLWVHGRTGNEYFLAPVLRLTITAATSP